MSFNLVVGKKPFLFQPICTGIYEKIEKFKHLPTFAIDIIQYPILSIVGAIFFTTSSLAIAVFFGRRKMMTNSHLIKPPKSLESLVMNISVIGLMVFSILCNVLYWGG